MGNPGVGDISKQMLYEKSFYSLEIQNRYNLFLFPKLVKSLFEIKGFITFDLFPNQKIYNVFLNPDQIFESYLHESKLGYSNLDVISNKIDKFN